MIQGIQHWKYDDRLNYLGLMHLEYRRRVRSDLIEIFKITKGMYDVNKEVFFELDDSGRRGHEQKLFKMRFRLDIRKFVFSNRVVNDWNSVSSQCVNNCTVNTCACSCQLCIFYTAGVDEIGETYYLMYLQL